jgi:hypothetical protein
VLPEIQPYEPPALPYYPANQPSTEILPPVHPPIPQPLETRTWSDIPANQPYGEDQPQIIPPPNQPTEVTPYNIPHGQPVISDCPECDRARQIEHQAQREIEVEQRQLGQQRIQQIRRQQDEDQRALDRLQQLERQPVDRRDIPRELEQKHAIANRQPELAREAQDLHQRNPQIDRQPVQFCMECDDQEHALKFLNGEIAACNVVPGSQQTGHARVGESTIPVEINAGIHPNYPPEINPDAIEADAYDEGFAAAEKDSPVSNPYPSPPANDSERSLAAAWDEGFRDAYSQLHGERGN